MNKITLSTPTVGKEYCFDDYCRGILNLNFDLSKIDYLVIDNSNSKEWGKRLDEFAREAKFGSYRRYVYDKPHFTIENTTDYASISNHVHEIYMFLQSKLPNNEFTFNVEDDVEIPPNTLTKLLNCFMLNRNIVTVVGSCCSRRLKDRIYKRPMAWMFKEVRVFPFPDTCEERTLETRVIQTDPPFGIQIIGSAHIGCWLTKTRIIREIKFNDLCGFTANDIAWGYKLNKAGYYFVIDWSVKTKHYHWIDGKKGYIQSSDEVCLYDKITGWFNKDDYEVLKSLKLPIDAEILELGTYYGRSTAALAELFPIATITTVDPHHFPHLPLGVKQIRGRGYEIEWVNPLDLLFIDDDHNYETIKKDIYKFKPLIKQGGYIVLHDYGHPDHPDVKKAVDELLPDAKIVGKNNSMAMWQNISGQRR